MKRAFFYARKCESDLPNHVEVYGFLCHQAATSRASDFSLPIAENVLRQRKHVNDAAIFESHV